jgi:hypothetical protein
MAAQPSSRPPRGRAAWVLIGAVSIAVVVLFVVLVPFPHPFAISNATHGPLSSCSGLRVPGGSYVSFTWSTAKSSVFGVWSCSSGAVVYQGNGTSGSGSFSSAGGVYSFGTECTFSCSPANVTGEVYHPLMPL